MSSFSKKPARHFAGKAEAKRSAKDYDDDDRLPLSLVLLIHTADLVRNPKAYFAERAAQKKAKREMELYY
ncbi:hypothetical protein C0991_007301 [Blastosporella zonata]|nr:hypothetical protein C0991_010473 [Blastosporella zonata]KAG6850799.1 hypothetical protein C0991_010074 [Blastosporella zonata]KAG6851655.1 hypothetical protein C0991_007301 [Blastosporella zonata]